MSDLGHAIRPPMVRVPDDRLRRLLAEYLIVLSDATPVATVGLRGWAESQLDVPAENAVGLYDDALCVVTREGSWTFQGNTDPSRILEGRAILVAGQVVAYGPGVHNRAKPPAERRPAFIQQSGVQIRRFDAEGNLGDLLRDQWIGCNQHDGSNTTTGSACCQTIAPEWWPAYVQEIFNGLDIPFSEWATVTTRIKQDMDVPPHWARARFPYLLVNA